MSEKAEVAQTESGKLQKISDTKLQMSAEMQKGFVAALTYPKKTTKGGHANHFSGSDKTNNNYTKYQPGTVA